MKKTFLTIICMGIVLMSCSKSESWTPVFNGQNLDNWEKFIGPAFEGHEDLAANATPDNVFSLVDMDDQKVIHISGEVFGSLSTKESFKNFHAKIVMKWGEKITNDLNCGFLYYGHGPFGAGFNTWKSSIECQLKHGNMGDAFMIGEDILMNAEAVKGDDAAYTYKSGAGNVKFGKEANGRIIHGQQNAENEIGQWNIVEIYCVGQQSVHVVNGKVTLRTNNISCLQDGKEIPLTEGCLQLQSEGGELFVKSVEVQPIKEIPAELLKD